MKRKLISSILAILFPVSAFCADWLTAEVCGTEMSFWVSSETDKTCVVAPREFYSSACIDKSYAGEIIIPSEVNGYTVVEIGILAFYGCEGITSIHIPSSIKTINKYAFAGCYSLTSVNITDLAAWCNIQFETKENDEMILPWDYHLYLNGEEVKELSIPNTVTSISAHAFRSCASITSVDIPSSVTSIGEQAFALTQLTSVTIPSQITSYKGAFAGCTLLTSVEISDGITLIDEGAFSGCTHLTSIEIPNSVTTIGRIAFGGSGLTSITLPASVTTIEFGAFNGCNGLTSITLPASVTSIGEGAFYQCSALTSVISQIQEPFAFGNSAFADISDACVLYVPKGTKDAYIAAGWTEEVFKGGIVEVEEGEEVWSAEFPEASTIIPEDVMKNAWGTGTYTFTQFGQRNGEGLYMLRRYSLTNPNKVQFCVYDWGQFIHDDVNLIIDADYSKYDPVTGYVPLSVAPQSIGYNSYNYNEDVMVADSYLYTNTIQGEECAPEDYPSYFDEKNGRFVLNLCYYVSLGKFGLGKEYFQLDGYEPAVERIHQQKEDEGTYTIKYGV
ncbi:MAG: leucine-rich repeat domain-containing protein [Bacteroidaceae bacterium]|nr:leucine-rich repeat domain-containing protein [Bacteroidaceae bacterium]